MRCNSVTVSKYRCIGELEEKKRLVMTVLSSGQRTSSAKSLFGNPTSAKSLFGKIPLRQNRSSATPLRQFPIRQLHFGNPASAKPYLLKRGTSKANHVHSHKIFLVPGNINPIIHTPPACLTGPQGSLGPWFPLGPLGPLGAPTQKI